MASNKRVTPFLREFTNLPIQMNPYAGWGMVFNCHIRFLPTTALSIGLTLQFLVITSVLERGFYIKTNTICRRYIVSYLF